MKRELEELQALYGVQPTPEPYDYVMKLYQSFDRKKIIFSDEYYDALGIERD